MHCFLPPHASLGHCWVLALSCSCLMGHQQGGLSQGGCRGVRTPPGRCRRLTAWPGSGPKTLAHGSNHELSGRPAPPSTRRANADTTSSACSEVTRSTSGTTRGPLCAAVHSEPPAPPCNLAHAALSLHARRVHALVGRLLPLRLAGRVRTSPPTWQLWAAPGRPSRSQSPLRCAVPVLSRPLRRPVFPLDPKRRRVV